MAKTLATTCWVEIIHKKEFDKVVLDKNVKAFVVYIALLISKMLIYLAWKVQITLLVVEKIFVLVEYSDFTNIFLK